MSFNAVFVSSKSICPCLLLNLSSLHISYLVDTLKDNCVDAAKNRNGSMVLRLCLDVVDKKTKLLLSKDLIESAVVLSGHPVGNYVIQHLLEPPPNGYVIEKAGN